MNDVSVQPSHRTWLQGSIKGVMVSYSNGAKGSMQMGQKISDMFVPVYKKKEDIQKVEFRSIVVATDGTTCAGCSGQRVGAGVHSWRRH
jgi:hypothetical protein